MTLEHVSCVASRETSYDYQEFIPALLPRRTLAELTSQQLRPTLRVHAFVIVAPNRDKTKMFYAKILTPLLLTSLFASAHAQDQEKYLQAFPEAADGMVRFVIELPHKARGEDAGFRVEIIVGKMIETDGINQHHLGGEITAQSLEGWGFTYCQVKEFGPVASTRIGVPPGTKMVEQFVSMPSLTIPYNSRVPLVVYVPKGGEVRYRIWTASETTEKASEG